MGRIVIMGAGVGGLSAAHQLLKSSEKHEIIIIERNKQIGGLARSKRSKNNLHAEYCWHVIGKNYYNLWKILEEIPFDDSTVSNNLKPITHYLYGREGIDSVYEENENSFLISSSFISYVKALHEMQTLNRISLYDCYKLIHIFWLSNTKSLKELEFYDSILWKDFTKDMSEEAKKWIADSPAIYLGMDIDKLSVHTMLHLLRPIKETTKKNDFYTFNGTFDDKWFEPWRHHLENNGVKFIRGEISYIAIDNDKIDFVAIGKEIITGDIFINGLPVEVLGQLIPTYQQLATNSIQLQTQVLYFIDKKLKTNGPAIFIFPDTPWCLMVRSEGQVWSDPTVKEDSIDTDFEYEDILSTGIGIWSRKGLNGKTANQCTWDEIKEECWNQLKQSKTLFEKVKTTDNHTFNDVNIVCTSVWDSYIFDKGEMKTWEPKFSNNINTLTLRPQVDDNYLKNLKHATGYTRTNANIFNMESACEAGCRAAHKIDNTLIFDNDRDRPGLLSRFF